MPNGQLKNSVTYKTGLRELCGTRTPASSATSFGADLDGVYVRGAGILRWNAEGKLVSFTVIVRPLRGLQKLAGPMAHQLAAGQA